MQDFLFYLKMGWEHIISPDALDHQLFILALVAPFIFKDFKQILILVTAFTIGHSITLILSVLDVVRLPTSLVEFLIPLTICANSFFNILSKKSNSTRTAISYFLAVIFGLIHGMGFANSARLMIAKEQSLAVPLLGFNIGLELGQILVVVLVLAAAFVVITLCRANRRDWLLCISSMAFALALKMASERILFIS